MAASAPISSLFQPWEQQGSPWKQRPDQIRCAPGTLREQIRSNKFHIEPTIKPRPVESILGGFLPGI